MKKSTAGVSVVLATVPTLGTFAKLDDTSNVTVTNDTVVNETVDTSAATDNLASPDAPANGADLNASAGGNSL